MDEPGFGPDFKPFAEIMVEQGLNPVVISESPILDLDSIKMKQMYEKLKGR
jgi:deoxyribonuclease-4